MDTRSGVLAADAAGDAEQRFFRRILFSAVCMVVATAVLVIRLVYLQIVGHEHYAMLSRDNQIKIAPLAPTRGVIYDRNGEVLADNIPTYSLQIVPAHTPDLNATMAALGQLLGLTDDEVQRFESARRRRKSFESIPLRLQLSEEEIARFSVRMPWFPGVSVHANMVRTYPYTDLAAHVVGYVGRISESDLQTLDAAAYAGTLHTGKSGLEKSYERWLHGTTGYEEIESDVTGRPLRALGTAPPKPGADLRLSLDIRLQRVAYDALGEHNGAVIALEPGTGRVLVMASKPAFDPNPFVNGIGRAEYQTLNTDPDRPLYDRATRGVYPPGSTVKPFVGLAGLETAELNPNRREMCPGYFQLPGSGHRYRDWRKGGHGGVDLKYGIVQSCDVYFYKLALRIGIDRLHGFMTRFGFGTRTGIDLDGETAGLFPSRQWKEKRRGQPWTGGDTVITGIGQGYVQVSPLQLARAVAILANRGLVITPRLVDSLRGFDATEPPIELRDPEMLNVRPESWKTVVDAMVDVVHSGRGTATRISYGLPFHVAGKTGTAQVFTVRQNQSYKSMKVGKKMQDHALFIAFAPAEKPRIAVAVIVENGGHGSSVAAPIARELMIQYLQSVR